MATIEELRATLLREKRERERIRDRPKVYGRFGEIVVEAWLRERQHLEVLPFPQTPETRSDYLEGAGKRPDFMVGIPPQDESEADTLVLMDAKFHSIGSGQPFWIGASEMQLYASGMAEWQASWLFFAVIDARAPNTLHLVERGEMVLNVDFDRWEYRLNSIPDRCEPISQEDLARAADRLAREGYDDSLLPPGLRSARE